ncbi:hypothetical protein [Nonomuraea sp. LPB2021202275-12-8]|uniref:hypothetical protein n=1 Tax=Nonomuraea sp. LPB2021202275-12-8 TaxID=3120159 RepID=UPI00300D4CAC
MALKSRQWSLTFSPPEDLDQLARAAAVSYECWVCMQPGKLPDVPAAVLILRDGPVDIAKLVHRFCARSGVMDVPGLTAVMYDPARAISVDAVAAFLPYQAGHRPALLLAAFPDLADELAPVLRLPGRTRRAGLQTVGPGLQTVG